MSPIILFQYVGAEFICAVRPILKERWTPELEEAWKVRRTCVLVTQKASCVLLVLLLLRKLQHITDTASVRLSEKDKTQGFRGYTHVL